MAIERERRERRRARVRFDEWNIIRASESERERCQPGGAGGSERTNIDSSLRYIRESGRATETRRKKAGRASVMEEDANGSERTSEREREAARGGKSAGPSARERRLYVRAYVF